MRARGDRSRLSVLWGIVTVDDVCNMWLPGMSKEPTANRFEMSTQGWLLTIIAAGVSCLVVPSVAGDSLYPNDNGRRYHEYASAPPPRTRSARRGMRVIGWEVIFTFGRKENMLLKSTIAPAGTLCVPPPGGA